MPTGFNDFSAEAGFGFFAGLSVGFLTVVFFFAAVVVVAAAVAVDLGVADFAAANSDLQPLKTLAPEAIGVIIAVANGDGNVAGQHNSLRER